MLPVYFEDRLVGTIEDATNNLHFTYDPSWRRSRSAFPISVSIPLTSESTDNALSWFWNLLPEEAQLKALGDLTRNAQTDIYGLLEKVGRETAGALSIGAPEATGRYRFLAPENLATALKDLPRRPFLADEPEITMSLAGAQSKLTVAVFGGEIALPLNGAASTHIIKPASPHLYASVENEAFCMSLSRAVGIETPAVSIGRAGEVTYLLVERYDRTRSRGKNPHIRRHHQEDAAQALGLPPTKKYETRGGASAADLVDLIDRYSMQKARDRLALLDRLIFSVAIHNTDAHAKNYSFFVERGGNRLAPAYDLLTSLIYQNITPNLAMKIAGKNRARHIQRRHWMRFAEEAGYAPASAALRAERLAAEIAEKAPSVEADLARNPLANRAALKQVREEIVACARAVSSNARSDSQLDRQTTE